ncbi:Na(+)/glucose symporter [Sphingobacterium spiritivorum]|nr:Na(+)/glucose symporter [Sphingobacterium spiritivorum]
MLPSGLKGLSFAALTAAVVASLAGKANSIATIFSLDVYKKIFDKNASEKKLISVGKITIIVSMILAVIIAPHLGIDKKGGFQYIQEYTGFVSPGIFAMFILGFFWKRTTSNAALFATIGGFFFSVFFKFLPNFADLSFLSASNFAILNKASGVYEIPFIDRMGFVFVICIIGMYIISKIENARGIVPKGLEIDTKMFKVHTGFLVGALIVIMVTAALYTIYW